MCVDTCCSTAFTYTASRALLRRYPSGPPSPRRWASQLFPIFKQCWNEHLLTYLPKPRGNNFPRSMPGRATGLERASSFCYMLPNLLSKVSTVGPQLMSFCSTLHCYNVDEVPEELHSCLWVNLALLWVVPLQLQEPVNDVKRELTVYQLTLPSAAWVLFAPYPSQPLGLSEIGFCQFEGHKVVSWGVVVVICVLLITQ